jgi:hypothetical protein
MKSNDPVPAQLKVILTYEEEFRRVEAVLRPALFERLKACDIALPKFEELVQMVCGVAAQHYREGAYHADIEVRNETRN